jgi:GLPGLI family protein
MNMHRLILVVLLFLYANIGFAQKQLQITYENKDCEMVSYKSSEIEVIASSFYCFSNTKTGIECSNYGDDIPYIYTHECVVFKDYQDNYLYYEETGDKIFVREVLNQFSWEVLDENRKILGYQCTKAKTQYRGREYTAWFTTGLPFKAAPWKFHGLPGVILKISSEDSDVQMEALQLKITEGEKKGNPYKKEDCIDYGQYVKIYLANRKKHREWMKATAARTGVAGVAARKPRIEKINDKDALSVEEAQAILKKQNK